MLSIACNQRIMFYGVWTLWTGLEDDWDSISSQAGMRSRTEVCLNPVSSHRFLGGHLGNSVEDHPSGCKNLVVVVHNLGV